jgi:hypothetical protein
MAHATPMGKASIRHYHIPGMDRKITSSKAKRGDVVIPLPRHCEERSAVVSQTAYCIATALRASQ